VSPRRVGGGGFCGLKFSTLAKRKRELQKVQRVLLGKMDPSGATLWGNGIQSRHIYMFRSWVPMANVLFCLTSRLPYPEVSFVII
jgi:hypothetical protein